MTSTISKGKVEKRCGEHKGGGGAEQDLENRRDFAPFRGHVGLRWTSRVPSGAASRRKRSD